MSIVLTEFARPRLFPREPRRNTLQDIGAEAFERHLNIHPPLQVLDGYAPFCKLHVHRNWTSTRCLTVPITDANRHLLRSAYEARAKEELPVLVRWFEGVEPPVASYLVVILYSRDGMKMGLEYPQHLEGAVLEVTDDGFNLKSPSIPGGMWLKNIIFIQMSDLVLIDIENIDALIALNRVLDWQLSPDVMFVVEQGGTTREYPLVEILSEPELLKDVTTFSLTP